MKISILNKLDIVKYIPEGTAIWISVSKDKDTYIVPALEQLYVSSLHLYFDDVASEEARQLGLRAMSSGQAESLVEFVMQYKDSVEEIVINCDAGLSRSAGIAVAICRMLGKKEDYCWIGRFPNTFVISKIMREYNGFIASQSNS